MPSVWEEDKIDMVVDYISGDENQRDIAENYEYSAASLSNYLQDLRDKGLVEKDGWDYHLEIPEDELRNILTMEVSDLDLARDPGIILFGVLSDQEFRDIAEHTEKVSKKPSIAYLTERLSEADYLREVSGEYIPGDNLTEEWSENISDHRIFDNIDPSRPLDSDEDEWRWMLGENLYQMLESSSNQDENQDAGPSISDADKEENKILQIGDELLEGHTETIEQKRDGGIETREGSDSEEGVGVENDNAGYEGFT